MPNYKTALGIFQNTYGHYHKLPFQLYIVQ